jgi:DivIVA domain-containing protein
MSMEWFLWGMVVVILGLASLVAAGRLGGMPAVAVHDSPVPELPERPLTGDDLRVLRFAVAPRGYSMAQVDDLLDRLAGQLDGPAPAGRRLLPPTEGVGGSDEQEPGIRRSVGRDSSGSAIMDENVSWQPGNEGEHGSNEAPHG